MYVLEERETNSHICDSIFSANEIKPTLFIEIPIIPGRESSFILGVLYLSLTHQLLVYADDVNLLGDDIDAIKKNTQTLIDAAKEVGLEVNMEKTKYMLLSRHQNVWKNHDINKNS
jgi:hypothetical protein